MENQASLNGGVFHLSARLYQEWGVVGLPDNWEVQLRNLRPKQRAERLAGWMLEWANGFLGPSREITRRCLLGLLWSDAYGDSAGNETWGTLKYEGCQERLKEKLLLVKTVVQADEAADANNLAELVAEVGAHAFVGSQGACPRCPRGGGGGEPGAD